MKVTAPPPEGVPVMAGDVCFATLPRVGVLVYVIESANDASATIGYLHTYMLVGPTGRVVGGLMSMPRYHEIGELESYTVSDGVIFHTRLTNLGGGRVEIYHPLAKWLSRRPVVGALFAWLFGDGQDVETVA